MVKKMNEKENNRLQQMIDVLEHYKSGGKITVLDKRLRGSEFEPEFWKLPVMPSWNFAAYDYSIVNPNDAVVCSNVNNGI